MPRPAAATRVNESVFVEIAGIDRSAATAAARVMTGGAKVFRCRWTGRRFTSPIRTRRRQVVLSIRLKSAATTDCGACGVPMWILRSQGCRTVPEQDGDIAARIPPRLRRLDWRLRRP